MHSQHGAVESGGFGAGAEHSGADVAGETVGADVAPPHAGEQGAGSISAESAPGVQRGDGAGGGVQSVGDGDLLAVAFLVGLRLPDVEQEAGGLVFDRDAAAVCSGGVAGARNC